MLPTGCNCGAKLQRVILPHWSSPRCSRLWSKQRATAPEDAVGAGKSHSAITLPPTARRCPTSFLLFPFTPLRSHLFLCLSQNRRCWSWRSFVCRQQHCYRHREDNEIIEKCTAKTNPGVLCTSEISQNTFSTLGLVSHVKIQLTCFRTICVFNC